MRLSLSSDDPLFLIAVCFVCVLFDCSSLSCSLHSFFSLAMGNSDVQLVVSKSVSSVAADPSSCASSSSSSSPPVPADQKSTAFTSEHPSAPNPYGLPNVKVVPSDGAVSIDVAALQKRAAASGVAPRSIDEIKAEMAKREISSEIAKREGVYTWYLIKGVLLVAVAGGSIYGGWVVTDVMLVTARAWLPLVEGVLTETMVSVVATACGAVASVLGGWFFYEAHKTRKELNQHYAKIISSNEQHERNRIADQQQHERNRLADQKQQNERFARLERMFQDRVAAGNSASSSSSSSSSMAPQLPSVECTMCLCGARAVVNLPCRCLMACEPCFAVWQAMPRPQGQPATCQNCRQVIQGGMSVRMP